MAMTRHTLGASALYSLSGAAARAGVIYRPARAPAAASIAIFFNPMCIPSPTAWPDDHV
jgi:hypothetical protein